MANRVSRQELRKTIWIGGPALEGDEGWLWLTKLELINDDPGSKTYVTSDHEVTEVSFGLRVLQQEPDSTELKLAQTIDGKANESRKLKAPRLLWSAYKASTISSEAYFEVKSRDIRVPDEEYAKHSYRDFCSPLGVNSVEQQGLLIPAEKWPDQPKHKTGLLWRYARFRMPPFRLVEGQIEASIYPTEGQQTIDKRLQIDFENQTLLGSAKFDADDKGGFPCAFVPTGIEFNIKLPNPLSAFLITPTDELELFVRLAGAVTDEGFNWYLELIGGDSANLAELNEGITNALSSMREGNNAPLSIEYNNTNRVPKIRWNLEQDSNQRLSIDEGIELDRSSARVTLLSGEASKKDRRGVAFLPEAKLVLKGRVNPELTIECGSDVSGTMQVQQMITGRWRRPTYNAWTLDPPDFELLAEPDIEGMVDQLTPIYEASGVWQEGRAPCGFLAVDRGLVQLPLPSKENFLQEGAESEETLVPSANGFVGDIVLPSSASPERYVQIDSAGYIKLEAIWDGDKFASVSLQALLPNGALHGYVWSVNSSPDADDVLPVPRAGGIATSDIPQYFNATGKSRCYRTHWLQKYEVKSGSGDWSATVTSKGRYGPIAWIRHRKLPAIPTVNTNRVSTSSVRPSETRNLIPLSIAGRAKSDDLFDLFVLRGGLDSGLPKLSLFEAHSPLSGDAPWPPGDTSEPLIPLFMPTLPDVEFTPGVSVPHGYEGIDEFRLSFSLAALDELFANASLPTPTKTNMPLALSDTFVVADQSARLALTAQVGDVAIQMDVSKTFILQTAPATVSANWKEVLISKTSVITALTLNELKQAWTDKLNKLDLTKTQGQYVFGWKAWTSTPVTVAVDKLLEPFIWTVDIVLGEENGEAVPFGKYVLDGIAFDGEKVVGGLGSNQTAYFEIDGATLVRKERAQGNTVPVVGWAASTYVEEADAADLTAPFQQLVVDHLGWKQQRYLEEIERYHQGIDGSLLFRAVDFSGKTPGLVTFKVAQDWGHGLVFWCRDLPMTKTGENWLFESSDNALEGALNPNDLTRIRGHLPETVHEWRLFNEPDRVSNAGAFYVQFGPIRFRPLRLIKLSLHETDPTQDSLQVLGSVSVAVTATNAGHQSYAGEKPYQTGNLTLLRMSRGGVPVLESKVLKVVDSDFTLEANDDGIQQQYSTRVFSEVVPGGSDVPWDQQSQQIILLQFKFAADSANLDTVSVSARLFGEIRTFDIAGGPILSDRSLKFEERFGTPKEYSGWFVTRACLTINLVTGYANLDFDASTTIEDERSLPVASIEIKDSDANIRWLNCTITNQARISIDHHRGTLDAFVSDARSNDSLIANMSTPEIKVDLHIALVFSSGEDGTRQAGQLSGVARQQGYDGDGFSDFVVKQTFVIDSEESERDQPLLVSLKLSERTSGVNWPVATTDIVDSNGFSSVVRMAGSESVELTHHVATSLNEHQLSLSLLGRKGDRIYLQKPWKVLTLVAHKLNWNSHPELDPDNTLDQQYKTIDNLTIRPVSTNSKLGDSGDLPAVFAARYWAGEYRDQEEVTRFSVRSRKYMLHPTLARAAYGHSGFNDEYISDALSKTSDDQLLVFGASHLFLAWDEEGDSSFLSLPYVAALSSAALPAPFDKIQSPVGTSDWTASNIDAHLSTGNIRLTTKTPTVFASTSQREAALVARFQSSMSVSSKVSLPDPVDQAIVTPVGDPENAVTDCPLFLRSLIALKQVNKNLKHKSASPGKLFVHALSQNQSGVVVGQIETQESGRTTPQFRTSVVAIGFQGATRVEIMLPSSGNEVTTYALGEKAAREAVTAVLSRASVILIAVKREDLLSSFVTYPQVRAIRIRGLVRNPASRIKTDLRDPQQIIYASPAYGWPEADSIPRATRQAVLGGDDVPFQSTQAGFAGRTAVFGTLPAALSHKDQPVYMFTAVKTIFERPLEPVAAVAADHLSVPTRRMRVPKADAVAAATPKVKVKDPSTGEIRLEKINMAPITPSYVERARLGDRPGILQHSIDGFVVAGPESSAERLHGAPGTIGPASVRQVRSTRSPALPRLKGAKADSDQVFQKSRRTFVSKLDYEDDEFVSFKWSRGGLAMVRHEFEFNKADARTFFAVNEANATLSADWKGSLIMTSCSEFGAAFDSEFSCLAHLGFLRKIPGAGSATPLVAELVINTESFPFLKLVLSQSTNQRLTLTFSDVEGYLRVQELLEVATADTSIGFRLQPVLAAKNQLSNDEVFTLDDEKSRVVSLQTSIANRPEPGPPRMVYIPLMIKPVDRPSLPVRLSTVLFGDPSYDRMLSSNAAADAIIRENDRWLLALDREVYDPTSTIYLAYGKLDQDDLFTSGNSFKLEVQQIRNGIARPFDLRLNDGDFDPIQSNTGYGVNIGSLVYKREGSYLNNQPIHIQSGDQLVFTLPVSPERALTVRVRVVTQPVVAPPPSAYYFVRHLTDDDGYEHGDVPICDTSPMPQVIEFPNLVYDLARGRVRRSAQFVWYVRELATFKKEQGGLVKFDRSGGGQIPGRRDLKSPSE